MTECPVDVLPLRDGDPARVDDYRLVARLGAGGMADVFFAVDPTGEPVAVKVLRTDVGAGSGRHAGAVAACRREYRLARSVDAGCTAPALSCGVSAAGPYLVSAYLPGYRCATTLAGRPMPDEHLWALGSALAGVLAAMHTRGVVHCDVKPSNLLVRWPLDAGPDAGPDAGLGAGFDVGELEVSEVDVRVIDFGIARLVGERCGDDGVVQCSPGFAAPEQLRAGPAAPPVDIFAWGCVLAHLAGGVRPFADPSDQEWLLRVLSATPDLTGLPRELAEVVGWTLARDPADRPSARELAAICRARAFAAPGIRSPTESAASRPGVDS